MNGTLPMALVAKKAGYPGIMVPYDNRFEASVVDGIDVFHVGTLAQVAAYLGG